MAFHMHKWETIERWKHEVDSDFGVYFKFFVRQQCEVCGKEMIRKTRS